MRLSIRDEMRRSKYCLTSHSPGRSAFVTKAERDRYFKQDKPLVLVDFYPKW